MTNRIKIFPLGTGALTVEFGNEISEMLNRQAIKLGAHFEQNKFPGFIETVPAYASVTIFYDVSLVAKNFPNYSSAFEAVQDLTEKALRNLTDAPEENPRLIEIPVYFDEESAPDLEFVAQYNHLERRKVIEIFTSKIYRVFMLGFLPGFAYMGEIDASIAAPRKQTPRVRVPKGSVGIAGRQTGIYSLESPGGWQIIGKTETELFTLQAKNPCLLQAGNSVKFYEGKKKFSPQRRRDREKIR
jgi:inhibitor of KinA